MNTLKYKDLLVPDQGKSNANTSKSTSYNPIAMSYASPLSSGNITPNVSLASAEGLNSETVKPLSYEEWYNRSKSNAEESYQNSVDLARINFEKMKSEYGSRAAALESMGMTGSGYSDYLTSKAYTEMQGVIVNAAAQKDKTIADLDTQLTAYLEEQEAKKKQEAKDYADRQREAYTSLYNNVLSGVYSYNDIDTLAAKYGLSPDDRDALKSAIADRIVESGNYDEKMLAKFYGVGSEKYNKYYNEMINSIKNSVSSDMFKDLDEATAKAAYEAMKATIQKQLSTASGTADELKSLQSTLDTLTNAYNDKYNNPITVSTTVSFNKDAAGGHDQSKGDRFTIKGENGKYAVQFTGRKAPQSVVNAASRNPQIVDGAVFRYNGTFYIRIGNGYYEFESKNSDDWSNFIKEFNNQSSTTEED